MKIYGGNHICLSWVLVSLSTWQPFLPYLELDSTKYLIKVHFTHETESPWPLHFKHFHWWKRGSWSKFASHYAWGTNGICECKMDVKSTWISTWHWMDHVSWCTWIRFKNHELELGLTQNRETLALQTLRTADLSYFIMCEDLHK